MGKYYLHDSEVPEPTAAAHWFKHAQAQGMDVPQAINIWEDAATEQGAASRLEVGNAGIDIRLGDAE